MGDDRRRRKGKRKRTENTRVVIKGLLPSTPLSLISARVCLSMERGLRLSACVCLLRSLDHRRLVPKADYRWGGMEDP